VRSSRVTPAAGLLAALALAAPARALAASDVHCLSGAYAYEDAAVVVAGVVESRVAEKDGTRTRIRVTDTLRGERRTRLEILDRSDAAGCPFLPVKVGKRYLFLVDDDPTRGLTVPTVKGRDVLQRIFALSGGAVLGTDPAFGRPVPLRVLRAKLAALAPPARFEPARPTAREVVRATMPVAPCGASLDRVDVSGTKVFVWVGPPARDPRCDPETEDEPHAVPIGRLAPGRYTFYARTTWTDYRWVGYLDVRP